MLKRADEGQVHQLGGNQGEERDLHWRTDVLLGIEARRQNLTRMMPSRPTE